MPRFERSLIQTTRQHIVTWSDAAGHNRMVAVIVHVPGKGWEWTRWQVPKHVLGRFLERHDNYIGLLGMFGVVITHTTWRCLLKGALWTAFCDNDGVVGNIGNGAVHQFESQDANNVLGRFWMELAKQDTGFYISRVPTKMNAADEPSRDCMDLVKRLQARWKDPSIPSWLTDVWRQVEINSSDFQ